MQDFDQQYQNWNAQQEARQHLEEVYMQLQEEDSTLNRKQYLYGNDFKIGGRFSETDL